jgi:hypothetical protein
MAVPAAFATGLEFCPVGRDGDVKERSHMARYRAAHDRNGKSPAASAAAADPAATHPGCTRTPVPIAARCATRLSHLRCREVRCPLRHRMAACERRVDKSRNRLAVPAAGRSQRRRQDGPCPQCQRSRSPMPKIFLANEKAERQLGLRHLPRLVQMRAPRIHLGRRDLVHQPFRQILDCHRPLVALLQPGELGG